MKRLWMVQTMEGIFWFDSKENAKAFRDDGVARTVEYGPDHRKYKGESMPLPKVRKHRAVEVAA